MNSKLLRCTYLAGLSCTCIVDLRIFAYCIKIWLPFYAIILQIALLLGYLFEGSEGIQQQKYGYRLVCLTIAFLLQNIRTDN